MIAPDILFHIRSFTDCRLSRLASTFICVLDVNSPHVCI